MDYKPLTEDEINRLLSVSVLTDSAHSPSTDVVQTATSQMASSDSTSPDLEAAWAACAEWTNSLMRGDERGIALLREMFEAQWKIYHSRRS